MCRGGGRGGVGGELSKVNSLSAQSLWIEKLKIMNDTHTRTNRSILLPQIQFCTELLTHSSHPLLIHQPSLSSLFAFTEASKWNNNNTSSRCWQTLFPCLSLCVCVCVSVGVCLRVSMWLTHLEACRQRSARSAQVFKFISFSQGYIARSPSAQLPFACQENNVFFLLQKLKSYFHDRK